MMLWFDILTPKQLLYFTSIARILQKHGFQVFFTSRRYEQLDALIEESFKDWGIKIIGRFGGYDLRDKLRVSVERLRFLLDAVPIEEIDLVVSSGSIEASRIAYGLKKPHILASDSPHSPVNPLTAPISRRILTPWIIEKSEWTRYGVRPSQVKKYRVIDPYFWLKDFHPDDTLLRGLGISDEYVLVRLPESAASYLMIDDAQYVSMLKNLIEVMKKHGMKTLIMARYREQSQVVERFLSDKDVILLGKPVIASHLIYYSKIFIGGGGTMTQEAALLGKPSIMVYPGETPTVLRFLSKTGLVKHCRSLDKSSKTLKYMLKNIDEVSEEFLEKSTKLWKIMRNPEEKIVKWLKETLPT
ncbi:MAG: DUF354 domain-containing protein [Nitrososphaerota archaeon]